MTQRENGEAVRVDQDPSSSITQDINHDELINQATVKLNDTQLIDNCISQSRAIKKLRSSKMLARHYASASTDLDVLLQQAFNSTDSHLLDKFLDQFKQTIVKQLSELEDERLQNAYKRYGGSILQIFIDEALQNILTTLNQQAQSSVRHATSASEVSSDTSDQTAQAHRDQNPSGTTLDEQINQGIAHALQSGQALNKTLKTIDGFNISYEQFASESSLKHLSPNKKTDSETLLKRSSSQVRGALERHFHFHEDSLSKAPAELGEAAEQAAHDSEKIADTAHRLHLATSTRAIRGLAVTSHIMGPVAFIGNGIYCLYKVGKGQSLTSDDKQSLIFSAGISVLVSATSVATFPYSIIGALATSLSWVGYAAYKDYEVKYHDRGAIDQEHQRLQDEIQSQTGQLKRLQDKLETKLNAYTQQANATFQSNNEQSSYRDIKQIKDRINEIYQAREQNRFDLLTIREVKSEMDREKRSWKPSRSRRQVMYDIVGVVAMPFALVTSAVVGAVGLTVASCAAVASFLDSGLRKNTVNLIKQGFEKLTGGNKQTSSQPQDANDEQSKHNQKPSQPEPDQIKTNQKQKNNRHYLGQSIVKSINQGWEAIKQGLKNLFIVTPGEQQLTKNQQVGSKPSKASADEQITDSGPDSTAELMSKFYGSKASEVVKQEVKLHQKEKDIDDHLAHIINNQDLAQSLKFLEHTSKKVDSLLSSTDQQNPTQKNDSQHRAAYLRNYLMRFDNAKPMLSQLLEATKPLESDTEGKVSTHIFDDVDKTTLEAVYKDADLKQVIARSIGEYRNLEANEVKHFEQTFDNLLQQAIDRSTSSGEQEEKTYQDSEKLQTSTRPAFRDSMH